MGQNCYLSLGFDIHVFHPELSYVLCLFFHFCHFLIFFVCESDNTYSIITPRSAHVGWLNVQWLYTENFEAKSTLMVTKSVGSMLRRSR